METFSILGTGWLGLTLANHLQNKYKVKVSTRHKTDLQKYEDMALYPFFLDEKNLDNLGELLDTDYLFINFPPSKFEDYIGFLKKIYSYNKISKIKKIIFVSSTSIYANENITFNEKSTDLKIDSLVYKAEELVKNKTDVIFRCSGLMGENRIAGKYFSNKHTNNAEKKVNYVHKTDVINATTFTLENDTKGVFNLCASSHPTRKEIYLFNSKKYAFKAPIFSDENINKDRIIVASKIEELGFKYKYSNPFDFD